MSRADFMALGKARLEPKVGELGNEGARAHLKLHDLYNRVKPKDFELKGLDKSLDLPTKVKDFAQGIFDKQGRFPGPGEVAAYQRVLEDDAMEAVIQKSPELSKPEKELGTAFKNHSLSAWIAGNRVSGALDNLSRNALPAQQ